MTGIVARDGGEVECTVGAQDGGVDNAEPQSPIIEVTPQSPTSSTWFGDIVYPPSSDGSAEMMDVGNPGASGDEVAHLATLSVVDVEQSEQLRKRVKGSGDEDSGEHGLVRKRQKKRVKESDDESSEDCTLSRSAGASRKLNESLRSGTFVVDEGKRERFERKCRGIDGHAKFRYKQSWQVRHSKCSHWVTMREPYDSVRFRDHAKGCKRMGEKGRDGTIDSFFKPRDVTETGTTRMAQPSARTQIFTGARTKLRETLIKLNPPSIPFISSERPCLGLRKDQDEQINTYISRVITEGAGSRSDAHFTKIYFGDGVNYSELDNDSKLYVAAAQVHLQKWKISHTLGSAFSADCRGKVAVTSKINNSACDQCLGLLKMDTFKKALSIQPPPLENLKYTPHRHRNAATSLGINLAKIEGVSGLLEKVNYGNFRNLMICD